MCNITKDYNEWIEKTSESLIQNGYGITYDIKLLECFKGCKSFMTMPVAKIDDNVIEAKSVSFDGSDVDDQITTFVKGCGDDFIPYVCLERTTKGLAVDENFVPVNDDIITTKRTVLRYALTK